MCHQGNKYLLKTTCPINMASKEPDSVKVPKLRLDC